MNEEIFEYIEKNFPDLQSDINVRFELGEPFENGTDERIRQSVARATTLFEEVFKQDDFIYLYIIDYGDGNDVMFGNPTPSHIYSLFEDQEFHKTIRYWVDEDVDESGNNTLIKYPYYINILSSLVSVIPYKNVLAGIANYEQGRTPSISQRVYFISTKKDLVFHMYDDRGCIVYSNAKNKLRHLYINYNDWLVDYWCEYFDALYMQ